MVGRFGQLDLYPPLRVARRPGHRCVRVLDPIPTNRVASSVSRDDSGLHTSVRTDAARFVNLSNQSTSLCVSSIGLQLLAANMRQSRCGTKDCVLLLPQSRQRINSGRSPCRRIASENRGAYEDDTGQHQDSRIVRLGLEQKRFDKPGRA